MAEHASFVSNSFSYPWLLAELRRERLLCRRFSVLLFARCYSVHNTMTPAPPANISTMGVGKPSNKLQCDGPKALSLPRNDI